MSRRLRTRFGLAILSTILLSALAATLVLGQGGTGRVNTNSAKPATKTPPRKKTTTKKPPLNQSSTSKPGSPTTKSSPVNNPPTNASTTKSKAGTIVRNQMGMEFVWIPPGSFIMGSENGEADEKPVHRVTFVVNEEAAAMARFEMPKAETEFQTTRRELKRAKNLLESKVLSQAEYDAAQARYNVAKAKLDSLRTTTGEYGFYMGKYEVTQAQWQSLMGNNPSFFRDCATCPVERVSWEDAQEFLDKLNDANDGFRYRLPTEAEWEYACRARTTGDYAGSLDAMAWYRANSGNKTNLVGMKQPNAFGLYDMQGNVWEWCLDWYHDSYSGAPTDGRIWWSEGEQKLRVLRGGSWNSNASDLRFARRTKLTSDDRRFDGVGFRVVAVVQTR